MNNLPTITLTSTEKNSVGQALASLPYAPDHTEAVVQEAGRRLAAAAPARLLRALNDLRENRLAGLAIANVPQDDGVDQGLLHPDVAVAPKATRISEGLVLGAAELCGHAYGVSTEGEGVVNNLCPTREHQEAFTGLGSNKPLGLHIEHALPARLVPRLSPDGLALVGVHGEPGGGPLTYVADGRRALKAVGPAREAILRDPRAYWLRLPVRWRLAGGLDGRLAAIVTGEGRDLTFAFAFYGDMTTPLTPAAAEALEAFKAGLETTAAGVRIAPGVCVLINNRLSCHGRSSFASSFLEDGAPLRWIQRTFWTADLARFAAWDRAGPRVFTPAAQLL